MNDAKNISLKDRIENEHRNRNAMSRFRGMSNEYMMMTSEQRNEYDLRKSIQNDLDFHFRNFIEGILKVCPNPKYLLVIPWVLAQNNDIGTNAVMHLIVNDEITPLRRAHIDELHKDIWMRSNVYLPSTIQLLTHFNRLDDKIGDMKNCTIAECYWLLELAKWLGCEYPTFEVRAKEAIVVNDMDFDFLRVLDKSNTRDVNLRSSVIIQYEKMEELLGRI